MSQDKISSDFIEFPDKGKEKIKVISLLKDRIIFQPIVYTLEQKTVIIDPITQQPINQKEKLSRYGLRGRAMYVGKDIAELCPELVPGATFFIEDERATSGIRINGILYASTRLSNIFLIYNDPSEKFE